MKHSSFLVLFLSIISNLANAQVKITRTQGNDTITETYYPKTEEEAIILYELQVISVSYTVINNKGTITYAKYTSNKSGKKDKQYCLVPIKGKNGTYFIKRVIPGTSPEAK